jgi:hypothetical protein
VALAGRAMLSIKHACGQRIVCRLVRTLESSSMLNIANPGDVGHEARIYVLRPGIGTYEEIDVGEGHVMRSRRNATPALGTTRPPDQEQAALPVLGPGHPDAYFVNALMAIQNQIGENKAALQGIATAVETLKSKVDQLGDVKASFQALATTVESTKSKVDQWGDVKASFQTLATTVESTKSKVDSWGDVKASFQTLTTSVESTKSKVDELMAWKNRILGGAVVVGVMSTFVLALLGVGFKTFYDTLKAPQGVPAGSSQPATAPK